MTLNPKTRERVIQLVESFVLAVISGAALAVGDYFYDAMIAGQLPAMTQEGVAHLALVAKAGAMGAAVLYWKNKRRLPEAHLPELGHRGDRHDDEPPPPPPVVAVAKAAVQAMKSDGPRPDPVADVLGHQRVERADGWACLVDGEAWPCRIAREMAESRGPR